MRANLQTILLLGCWLCALHVAQAASPLRAPQALGLERVFGTVALRQPLALIEAPFLVSDASRFRGTALPRVWYVVEKSGRVLRLQQLGETVQQTVFADLRKQVDADPSEAGLLGMALDPGFAQTGRVYFSYTRPGSPLTAPLTSVLSRWQSRDGGQSVDPASEQILLQVEQPYRNHNGGHVHFGPDGFLYWGLGDGGAAGDPKGNGQDTRTLLGSLLRLDVSGDGGYRIPPGNPFVKGGGRPEIFAYGLRNPWRWSFDRRSGDLWLADVGQNAWEEINLIQLGGNYGWNLREGAHCYSADCRRDDLLEPVAEYSHAEGCSVTGGYVYRGDAVPALQGVYLFGDYCSGRIWGLFRASNGSYQRQLLLESGLNIASFAEDAAGEVYVIDLGGKIFRFVSSAP
ncbi:MAG: PQQ-dependent sugar dehydrogenase [Gammaproteobacteria bacterium]|nr:PQQ-dependent sugar dehydrogenase [Gammaproteobacteria bacterium]